MIFRKEFAISFTVVSVFVFLTFVFELCLRYGGSEVAESLTPVFGWIGWLDVGHVALGIILVFFLLFICACSAFSDVMSIDYGSGMMALQLTRCSKRDYVLSSLAVSALGGFAVVFIPFAFAQLLALIAFPPSSMSVGIAGVVNGSAASGTWLMVLSKSALFPDLLFSHPLIYNLVYCTYVSLWAALFSTASVCISMVISRNRLVVLGLPTLLYILLGFLLPEGLGLVSYLYPQSVETDIQAALFFLLPVIALVGQIVIVIAAMRKKDLVL